MSGHHRPVHEVLEGATRRAERLVEAADQALHRFGDAVHPCLAAGPAIDERLAVVAFGARFAGFASALDLHFRTRSENACANTRTQESDPAPPRFAGRWVGAL